jgi:hypothetical protein
MDQVWQPAIPCLHLRSAKDLILLHSACRSRAMLTVLYYCLLLTATAYCLLLYFLLLFRLPCTFGSIDMVSINKDCVHADGFVSGLHLPLSIRKLIIVEAAGLLQRMWCAVVCAVWLCGACCVSPWCAVSCTMSPVIFPEFLLFFLHAPIGQARHGSTEMTVICAI